VPIFSASRLAVARCRRGFTKKALAEMIDHSAQSLTFYEEERREPPIQVVHRLSFALGFPVSFFYDADINLAGAEAATFRSTRSLKASKRAQALAAGAIATEILSPAIRKRFNLPKLDLPDLSNEAPEAAAESLRERWKLGQGPINNMVHLLESKGVEVYWICEDDRSLDAFALWRGELPYILLNSTKVAGDRGRFDAAHELGHLVLHREKEKTDTRDVENEAHQFASAFLMPGVQFREESPRFPTLSRYYALKRRWGCSIQAMVRRGYDLKLFSEWHYEQAAKEMSSLGWRSVTPEPVPISREVSLLHNMVFDMLRSKDICPKEWAKELQIPLKEILELMPVSQNFLKSDKMEASLPVETGDNTFKLRFG
jgi:Zn-dependent peptidase ImmA (M78 family)/DNA-binding XRE family transcriptional regulator